MATARKLTPKQQAKANDKRVETAYHATCNNITIPLMKITDIHKVGLASIAAGDNDEVLGQKIRAYVETIRA